jgi:hypothetical protein
MRPNYNIFQSNNCIKTPQIYFNMTSPKSSTLEYMTIFAHSPIPARKRKSVFLDPNSAKLPMFELSLENESEEKPSAFLLKKLRQITCENEDDDYNYDARTNDKSDAGDDSIDENFDGETTIVKEKSPKCDTVLPALETKPHGTRKLMSFTAFLQASNKKVLTHFA